MRKRKEEDDYALLPHTGHLVLDKPFDQEGMYVAHSLSMERAALPLEAIGSFAMMSTALHAQQMVETGWIQYA